MPRADITERWSSGSESLADRTERCRRCPKFYPMSLETLHTCNSPDGRAPTGAGTVSGDLGFTAPRVVRKMEKPQMAYVNLIAAQV